MSTLNEIAKSWAATARGPVVVTGSAGYLGRSLAQTFVQAGIDVVGVQRKAEQNAEFDVVEGDLSCPGVLDSLLTQDTTIFHLAFTSSVARSVHNPRGDIRDNLLVAFEVLESARRFRSRLIYVSSICVADPNSPLPHSEGVGFSPDRRTAHARPRRRFSFPRISIAMGSAPAPRGSALFMVLACAVLQCMTSTGNCGTTPSVLKFWVTARRCGTTSISMM